MIVYDMSACAFVTCVFQVENQLATVTGKYSRLISETEESKKRMNSRIETLEAEKHSLSLQLDEEKR